MATIISTVISSLTAAVVSGVIKEGMLSLLRAEIIRQHDKYTQRQYCPIYAKDALTKAYAAYHSLGGNGTITKIYNETMQLPETAEEVKQ